MGNIFAASEVVEMGIQIEKNGRDFYAYCARRSNNSRAQEIFEFLSGEEEKHIQVFQGILGKIEKYQPQGLDSNDYFTYINALAGENVFIAKEKGAKIAENTKSDAEAIEVGIRAEKDSIVFYEGLKKVIPEYEVKIIDEVISQEQGHLRQLLELKSKL